MIQETQADVCQWCLHLGGAEGEEQRHRVEDCQGQLKEGRVHELISLLLLAQTQPEETN